MIQVSEKKPSFLVLFEIVEKAIENDENKIKAQFLKKADSKNFNETKYYLYNLILKALHNFNYDSDVSYNLQNQLVFARILYDKNLISDSRITTSKIIVQGGEYNDYVVVFQAAFLNLMAKFHQYDQQNSIDESMANYQIMMESLENLQNEVRFQLEYYKQFINYKYNNLVIDDKHKSSFNKLMKAEFVNKIDPDKATKLAKAYNYNIKTLIKLNEKNNDGALKEMTEYLEFYEMHPQFKKRHIKSYVSLLNNYAFTLRLNGRLQEAADSFLKLRLYIFNTFKK
ncbi:MAG: hypothetical protein IPG08_16920 [Sphingobacteriaceae bacterium]|nr:hypothetical protein [Sphingobacteriaceae bacterium]